MRAAAFAFALAACGGNRVVDHEPSAADASQLLSAVGGKPRAYARISMAQPKVRATLVELEPFVRPTFGKSLEDCGMAIDKLVSVRVAIGEPLRIAGEIDGAISVASVTCVIGQNKLSAIAGLVLRDREGGIAVEYNVDRTQADVGRVAAAALAARCRGETCAAERLGTTAKPIDVEIELGETYEIRVGGAGFTGAAAAVVAAIEAQRAATPALGEGTFRNEAGTLVASFPAGHEQAAAMALRETVLEAFRIPSTSMVPTLVQGDHVFAAKGALAGAIAPGDIVIYRHEDREYAKRVLGIAGQSISESDAGLAVDGALLPTEEISKAFTYSDVPEFGSEVQHVTGVELREHLGARSYTTLITGASHGGGPWTVPADQFFLVGDNRHNSNDSRFMGPVSRTDIVGRIVGIWWSWHDGAPDWDRIGTRVE